MTEDPDRIAQHLQEAILQGYSQRFRDEFSNPKNIGELEHADSHVRITGPCGDTIEMWLIVEDGKISDISFMTDGCGATITCASYVTRAAKGGTIEEALRITPENVVEYLEGLPDKHRHCAKLAVMTLGAAIEEYQTRTSQ
jgi:nitrogen fixation NifU-like protein